MSSAPLAQLKPFWWACQAPLPGVRSPGLQAWVAGCHLYAALKSSTGPRPSRGRMLGGLRSPQPRGDTPPSARDDLALESLQEGDMARDAGCQSISDVLFFFVPWGIPETYVWRGSVAMADPGLDRGKIDTYKHRRMWACCLTALTSLWKKANLLGKRLGF